MVYETGQKVLGPFVKSNAPTMHNFAFVVPVYDFDSVDDLAPAGADDGVGYQVFEWNEEYRSFDTEGTLYDVIDEAREYASRVNEKWRAHYEISHELTVYYVDDRRIPEEEKADPSFSLAEGELVLGQHGMPILP